MKVVDPRIRIAKGTGLAPFPYLNFFASDIIFEPSNSIIKFLEFISGLVLVETLKFSFFFFWNNVNEFIASKESPKIQKVILIENTDCD